MKIHIDLNLGEVVFIFIFFHLLNYLDFFLMA